MNERSTASQEQIADAMAYEDLFEKGLFKEWTIRVMEAARIRSGHRVLDVGCGTGVLARDAAMRVGPTGFVAGLDPSPGIQIQRILEELRRTSNPTLIPMRVSCLSRLPTSLLEQIHKVIAMHATFST